MINALLGRKIAQSQSFWENGQRIPVTVVEAGPCPVVQVKTREKDGYEAVQLGCGIKKRTSAPRWLREIRIGNQPRKPGSRSAGESEISDKVKLGDILRVGDVFQVGDKIQVTGTSKGKGFAGVVKRWGFAGGPRTRGQSDRERAPGSIGQTTTPGRVYKGKKMAGRLGGDQVTIKNLAVVALDKEKNFLTIKGLVPGAKNSLLLIKKQN